MKARTLIDEGQIRKRVEELAAQISIDFLEEDLIVLCVLKGGIFFAADLVRAMSIDVAMDFIQVSSYGNQKYSSGVVTILKEPQLDMRGRAVLIVEDIIDSGLSMREVHRYIESRGASRVSVVTFLDKKSCRKVPFDADYVGYTIDPHFVIGYGLDYAERYRNLREIQVLNE